MSYADGIAAMSGDSSVDGFFRSKEEFLGHLEQTNADMEAFHLNILRWGVGKSGDDQTMVSKFVEFYHRWESFYKSRASTWFGWGDYIEASENWRRRLIGWRKVFIARGMKPTTPDPELFPSSTPHVVPVLIAVSGAVIGAVVTDYIIRSSRGPR